MTRHVNKELTGREVKLCRALPSELGALTGDTLPLKDLSGGNQKLAGFAVALILLPHVVASCDPQNVLIRAPELLSQHLTTEREETLNDDVRLRCDLIEFQLM